MANEDLKYKIAELQREIGAVERELNEINGELNMIANSAASNNTLLMGTANALSNSMANNASSLDYTNGMINATFDTQLQIKELFFIFKDMETANKKIRALNNKLFFDFRDHAKVRKIVYALMDNLNLDIVSNETIYNTIEKEHLKQPDFWLTYVLLAVMFWKSNDQAKTEQCVAAALKLNEKNTVLFMFQFNLAVHRYSAALKWLQIFEKLGMNGSDAKTLLMLVSSLESKINNFDDRTNPVAIEVANFIRAKVKEDNTDVDHNALVADVCSFMEKLDTPETLKYEWYRKYVADYQQMANALSKAKNNETILEYFTDISHIVANEKNTVLDNYMSKLISEPSEGEKAIYDEIEYNENIIKAVEEIKTSKGLITSLDFKKIAKERYLAKKKHDESKLNSVLELMNWSYNGCDETINTLTKWNIFVLNKEYAWEGYLLYSKKYHALNPENHKVDIEEYSVVTDFKNKASDEAAIDTFIDNKTADLLRHARKPLFYIGIVIAILGLAGGLCGQILAGIPALLYLGLVAMAGGIAMAVIALITNIFKKKKIRERMERNRVRYKEIMGNIYEDKQAYDVEFNKGDIIARDIKNFFDGIL